MRPSIWARHEGKLFWGVVTRLSAEGTVYVWADKLEVRDGSLLIWGGDGLLNGGFAPEQWQGFFRADPDHGDSVARSQPRDKEES